MKIYVKVYQEDGPVWRLTATQESGMFKRYPFDDLAVALQYLHPGENYATAPDDAPDVLPIGDDRLTLAEVPWPLCGPTTPEDID